MALAQGWHKGGYGVSAWFDRIDHQQYHVKEYHPSTNGSQCMEIMEREKISTTHKIHRGTGRWMWMSSCYNGAADEFFGWGETAMIAICRCFVLSRLDVINNARI